MQLLGIISCAALMVSCKQAPSVEMEAEYAVLQVQPSDKVISTTYSATIGGRQDIDIYQSFEVGLIYCRPSTKR